MQNVHVFKSRRQEGQRRAGNRAAHLGVECIADAVSMCVPACRLSAKSRPSSPRWIGLQTPTAPTSRIRLNTTGECHMLCATSAPSRLATPCSDEQARTGLSRHRPDNSGGTASKFRQGVPRIGPTNHMPATGLLHVPTFWLESARVTGHPIRAHTGSLDRTLYSQARAISLIKKLHGVGVPTLYI